MPIRAQGIVERGADAVFARAWARGSSELRRRFATTVTRGFESVTYQRLRENGLAPDAIIDVGANCGDWSRLVRPIFPDATILMIEAQAGLEPELSRASRELGRATHRIALLGPAAGEERAFYEMGTGSSLLPENSNVARTRTVSITQTLDALAGEYLPEAQAIFLKLDIQGAELMVLAGGAATLERCAAVQLEVALLPYNAGAPLLGEVVAFMAQRSLLVTEVAGFSRPGAHLVQIDLVFARAGSPLRPESFTF